MKKLREKWWTHRSDCPDPKLPAAVTTMRISLDHMAGVFIVLAAGILVSIVFLMIERRCHNLRKEVKNSGVRSRFNRIYWTNSIQYVDKLFPRLKRQAKGQWWIVSRDITLFLTS